MARISPAVCLLVLLAVSAVYEVQGTFLLRHFLRKLSRRNRGDFKPFACKGMLMFVGVLEHKCPLRPDYKNFFGKLRSFVSILSSASGSKNIDIDLKAKGEDLSTAMAALGGKGGSTVDTSKVMDAVMSMGKTLSTETSSGSSTEMTVAQRKEIIQSMATFARVISQFVVSSASKSGTTIDMSSLGIDDIDASVDVGGTASPSTGGIPTTGASGPASSTTGGSAKFSGKTGATNYEGSVNYQAGKSSQQTITGSS